MLVSAQRRHFRCPTPCYSSARCVGVSLPRAPLEAPHSTVPIAIAIKVLVTDLEMTQMKHLPRVSKVAQWVKPPAEILL